MVNEGYSLVLVHGLLIEVASLVAEHRLQAHGLSCGGIFLDQGLNPCPLHWQVDSYPLEHQESLKVLISIYKIWFPYSAVRDQGSF